MKPSPGTYKLRRIRLLMIASYALLMAFAVQWLYTQYEKEENGLQKELSKLFDNVQQGITDSLLLVSIVDPGIKQIKPAGTTTENATSISLSDDTLKRLSSLLLNNNNTDLSLQGVRMVVRKVRQLTPGEKQYLFHIDTSVFNNEFEDRMRRMGWNFPVTWVVTTNRKHNEGDYIFIPNHYFKSGYGIAITAYRGHLLKGLWPQATFVLVLLSVILLAFCVTYRSLFRQIQLGVMKDDFVSNISHELKTPIATVKVALEAIQHFDAAGQRELTAEYMEMASLEMERLELLVNRSLHTSLIESGKLSMQPELCDLKTIVKEILLAYQVKFIAYNAEVELQTNGSHFKAMADKLHFQGVLVNLLDNSLKYGTGNIHIHVLLEQKDDKLTLSVTDNGPGIPEDYRSKVFEKFFRVPASNQHNVKGYGLGLSYAAQVMQQHKGSIAVVNVPEGGCRFIVSL
ncbi:MAG: HAMP domain-containing sensor histidine kinase [Taibaiella sp.]